MLLWLRDDPSFTPVASNGKPLLIIQSLSPPSPLVPAFPRISRSKGYEAGKNYIPVGEVLGAICLLNLFILIDLIRFFGLAWRVLYIPA
jgi:hypothetical protein